MRYYTKEWYALMQKSDITTGLAKVPDGKYTKKDIDKLFEKKYKKELRAEKKAYDTPPDLSYLMDVLEGEEFDPSDWVLADEATGKTRMPKDREEVRAFIQAEQDAELEEFNARAPFDEEDYRQMFCDIYEERLADLKRWPESGALGKADIQGGQGRGARREEGIQPHKPQRGPRACKAEHPGIHLGRHASPRLRRHLP